MNLPATSRRRPGRSLPAACALAASLACGLSLGLAPARQAHAQATAVPYRIAAGPLADGLRQFGRDSGLILSYSAEDIEGKRSGGLAGTYRPDEALDRLLAGTGLAARRLPNGSYAIRPQPAGAASTLPAIEVSGSAVAETAWGPVDGYVARRSATATKTDTPIIETPQSISVVTRDAIDTQGTLNVADALRYTAGVGAAAYSNGDGNAYDAFTMRGFVVSNSGLLRDGMRLNYNILDAPTEPYGLERIEVLKGPVSVMYGQSGPSGVVNLISKRPQAESRHEIEAQGGSHDRRQFATDHTGALNDDGTLLYRVTGLFRESDTYVDFNRDDRTYIAPALTWQPSARTRVTLLSHYQRSKSSYYVGLPYKGTIQDSPLGSPARDTNLGDPDFNYWDTTSKSLGYVAEHQFNDAWQIRQSGRYGTSSLHYGFLFPIAVLADNRTVTRQAVQRHDESNTLVSDTNLQGHWRGLGGEQTTLVGLDYARTHWSQLNYRGAASSIDLYDPVYGQSPVPPPLALRNDNKVRSEQFGLYAQQQSKFAGRWVVTLGGRQDWVESKATDNPTATTVRQRDHAFTGRAGLTYLAPHGFAPYVSYSTSFEPNSGTTYDGDPFVPTRGKQYEAGIKFQPEGSSTLVTLAAYHLTQTNVTTMDSDQVNHPGGLVQTGEIRSKGIELEAAAELTRSLRLRGALTLNSSEITRSNTPGEVGRKPADTPARMASLWLDYRFTGDWLPGLMVGAGARYVSGGYDAANSAKTASRTVYDAMLGYEIDRWKFTFNVINVFDKKYLASCYASSACLYGPPRTAMLTARYAW